LRETEGERDRECSVDTPAATVGRGFLGCRARPPADAIAAVTLPLPIMLGVVTTVKRSGWAAARESRSRVPLERSTVALIVASTANSTISGRDCRLKNT
jgi:hypothetical protein